MSPRVEILVPHKEFSARLTEEGWVEFPWRPRDPLRPGLGLFLVPNTVLITGPLNIVVDPGPFWVGRIPAVALARRGLVGRDIDVVIDTHLHTDHAGANGLFRGKRLIFHRAERAHHPASWIRYITDGMNPEPMEDREMALCEGVRLIHTPGHTPGSLCVLVETEKGRSLITGDADPGWVARLTRSFSPTVVIPGHEDPQGKNP